VRRLPRDDADLEYRCKMGRMFLPPDEIPQRDST
jgi:hypothetical protein